MTSWHRRKCTRCTSVTRARSACARAPCMLEISGLTGGWDQTTVVEDASLAVAAGETLAIVGRNGVGKSTLLELIVGRAVRRSGSVKLGGRDLSRLPVFR